MKLNTSIIKKSLLSLALVLTGLVAASSSASAAQIPWVPGQPLPSIPNPVFNTYTNVPYGIGDESDFVRLRPSNGNPTDPGPGGSRNDLYKDRIVDACAVGSIFDVRTYLHNGADDSLNENGNGPAVAHNVTVAMTAPLGSTAKNFTFKSTISASNAATVVDTGVLDCGNANVQLKLVPQTVKVYTRNLGWKSAPDSAVNGSIKVGSHVFGSGDVWGCWDERILLVYVIQVVEAPKPPAPVYTCDLLTLTLISDRKYRFDAKATAQNGAVVKSYRYDFNDGSAAQVNVNANTSDTTEHQYSKDGTFNPKVDVTFTVPKAEGGTEEKTVTGANCTKPLKIEPKVEMCTVPGKGHLPKNDPACAEVKAAVVVTTTTLPKTGIGASVAGLMGATTVAGTALHRRFTLRRNK